MSAKAQVIEHDEGRALTTTPEAIGALTPMDMLNKAVANGANIDVLEKLMGLQERWEKNQARKEFDAAIADAKAEIRPIARNRKGHNDKRYVDFAAIASMVDPIITKHGLSYRFRTMQDERINVTCVLSHKAGHYEETTRSGPADQTGNKNAIQAIGSTLTYLQRYSLVQMLGLAAGDDDDGQVAGNNDGPISDKQVDEIAKLIADTKSDIGRFLAWAAAPSVSDLRASQFNDCIAMLKAKLQRGATK